MENKKINYKNKCIHLEQVIKELKETFAKSIAEKELVITNHSEYIDELEKNVKTISDAFDIIKQFKYYGYKRNGFYDRVDLNKVTFSIQNDIEISERTLSEMR